MCERVDDAVCHHGAENVEVPCEVVVRDLRPFAVKLVFALVSARHGHLHSDDGRVVQGAAN